MMPCKCQTVKIIHPKTKKVIRTELRMCQPCKDQKRKDDEMLELAIAQDKGNDVSANRVMDYVFDEDTQSYEVNEDVRVRREEHLGFNEDSWLDVVYDDDEENGWSVAL